MWILSILPESFLHLIFWSGAIATFVGFMLNVMPFFGKYRIAIQAGGVAVLILGTYLEGALSNDKIWQLKALELQANNSKLETEISKQDVKIVEKVVTQTKIIKERGADVIKFVDREVIKYDTKFGKGGMCELPVEFYDTYNKSLELTPK